MHSSVDETVQRVPLSGYVVGVTNGEVFERLYRELAKRAASWGDLFISMLPNLIVAVLVMVLFWFLARAAAAVTSRTMKRLRAERAAASLLGTLVRLAVLAGGLTVALGVLDLDKALASVLAGAGIAGLALGFAFQDLAANLISGVGLAVKRDHPFKTGDLIETNDWFGVVEKVNLRTTTIQTLDGKWVIIPNKQIYQGVLVNHSASGRRRVELKIGVSYGEDLERVRDVTEQALVALPGRRKEPPRVYFQEFGDFSINFLCWFWIDYARQEDYLGAQNAAVLAIKRAYNRHDITIPFPIRTLDFGMKGGEKLEEIMERRQIGSGAVRGQLPEKG